MKKVSLIIIVFYLISCGTQKNTEEKRDYKATTIAFYNLENLFDPINDPKKYDEASPIMEMPEARREGVYKKKLKNMARVINDIGRELTKDAPAVVGLAEVENRKVIEDLLNEKPLKNHDYGIIHYDSPDERGIDVALIYRKLIFQPLSHSSHELILYERDDPDDRDYTRDQLLVTGLLDGDKISFIVNHWPSRSGGEKASRPFRNKAAKLNKSIIDSLQAIEPYAKIITMGDYNDGPYNESVKEILGAKAEKENLGSKGLFNPMENMQKRGIGTIAYRDSWDLFDQIILSKPLLGDDYSSYRYYKAGVFNPNYLANPRGRYQGYPFRSFSGGGFSDGYSDHFPVYIYLVKAVVKAQSNLKKTASK